MGRARAKCPGPQIMCATCDRLIPLALAAHAGEAVSITCPECASREVLAGVGADAVTLRREHQQLMFQSWQETSSLH